jgi:hypothetical protein
MACIVLKGLSGERRIPEGANYVLIPGESIIGIDTSCKGDVSIQPATDELWATLHELDTELNEQGKGPGDWIKTLIKPAARLMGRTNCMSCEARRVVANAYGKLKVKHGQVKALTIIKDLWKLSLKNNEEVVLQKLKEYLN